MILWRFLPHAVIKALKMLWQSKRDKSVRSANPRPRRYYSSVAKYLNKINPRIAQQIKSFCYFLLLQKVESPYHLDFNLQSEIQPIRSYIIYFSHYFKSFDLDTSLRINATLSMTKRFGLLLRLQRLAMTIRRRFTRFATFYTTLKESQCKLKG